MKEERHESLSPPREFSKDEKLNLFKQMKKLKKVLKN